MRRLITIALGIIVVVLFLISAVAVIAGTLAHADYKYEGFQATLLDLTVGGVVAFLAVVLGISVTNDAPGVQASLRQAVAGNATTKGGDILILFVAVVYVGVGLAFVLVALFPCWIATKEGSPPVLEAPSHITTQARAFVGVALAGLAALGTAFAPDAPPESGRGQAGQGVV